MEKGWCQDVDANDEYLYIWQALFCQKKKLYWPWSYSYAHFMKSTAAKYTNRARIFSNELNAPVTGQKSLWTHIHLYMCIRKSTTHATRTFNWRNKLHTTTLWFFLFFLVTKKNSFVRQPNLMYKMNLFFLKKSSSSNQQFS